METVLLIIHVMVALALVILILLQRSEGGALGIGGGAGGFMTARGARDTLSSMTKWCAVIFIANSLLLGWMATHRKSDETIFEKAAEQPVKKDDNQLPEIPTVPGGEG